MGRLPQRDSFGAAQVSNIGNWSLVIPLQISNCPKGMPSAQISNFQFLISFLPSLPCSSAPFLLCSLSTHCGAEILRSWLSQNDRWGAAFFSVTNFPKGTPSSKRLLRSGANIPNGTIGANFKLLSLPFDALWCGDSSSLRFPQNDS